jgi:chaperonin GroEL (HSP60 family)
MDAIDMLIKLRQAHKKGNRYAGVDPMKGSIGDMKKQNVLEPLRVGMQAIKSATESATMILRIDDVIASKGMEKAPPGGPAGGPGGYGGMPPEY